MINNTVLRSFTALLFPKNDAPDGLAWRDVVFAITALAGFLALMAATSTLLGFAAMRMPQWLLEVEVDIFRFAAGNASAWLADVILRFFNDPGIVYSVIVGACVGHVWIKQRSRTVAALAALVLAFSIGAWTIPYTHWFGYRPRPFVFAPDVFINAEWRQTWSIYPSFPSGHVRELTGLSVVLLCFWPGSRWFVVAYGGFVAVTRVYIGAHFVYDVIAGLIVGLMTGSFALLAVEQGRKLVLALAKTGAVRGTLTYFSPQNAANSAESSPLQRRLIRSIAYVAFLLLGTLVLGSLAFTQSPSILASYFLDVDRSLVQPIFSSFDPFLAPVVDAFFIDGNHTLMALGVLILGHGVLQGRRGLGQAVVGVALAIGLGLVVAAVFSPLFFKARPYVLGATGLPETWRGQWPDLATFPDAYLLSVTALSVLLASRWGKLRLPAYLFPFAVAMSLFYFGAAWPVASLATVVAGYWVARCSIAISGEILPILWGRGDDHLQRAGNHSDGDGHDADRPAVGMGRQP